MSSVLDNDQALLAIIVALFAGFVALALLAFVPRNIQDAIRSTPIGRRLVMAPLSLLAGLTIAFFMAYILWISTCERSTYDPDGDSYRTLHAPE